MLFRRPPQLEPEPEAAPVVNVRAWVTLLNDVALETDAGDLLIFDSPDRALEAVQALQKGARAALNGHHDFEFWSNEQTVPTAAEFEVRDATRRRWRTRHPNSRRRV